MSQWRRIAFFLLAALLTTTALGIVPDSGFALPARQETPVECAPIKPVAFPVLAGVGEPIGATPATAPRATPVASPVASPIASPVASPVASEAPATLAGDLERVIKTVAACQSTGRVRGLTRFVTERFLGDYFAGGARLTEEEFVAFAPNLPRLRLNIRDVTGITFDPAGRATAEVTSVIGRQLLRAEWSFVFQPTDDGDQTGAKSALGHWLADGLTPLPPRPPAGADRVRVRIVDHEYRPASLTVEGPDVVIAASNDGDDDHELLVLRLRGGVTTQSLLAATGPELPRGVAFIGQVTVPAGENGTLVLVGLSAGTYAIVDLLVDENGTPHLALGMEAELIVE